MAIYYVRKGGDDSNSGTSPDQAWATLSHAATQVAAGDTVYVGAGVYREKLTLQASGSNGSPIKWIADVTGEHTGDAGLVVITAWDSESGNWQARSRALDPARQTFNEFYRFSFVGGDDGGIVDDTAAEGYGEGVLFEECYVHLPYGHNVLNELPPAVQLRLGGATGPATYGFTFRRCLIWGELQFNIAENATAEVDAKIRIEDCLFLGRNYGSERGVSITRAVDDTYSAGGFTLKNCTFLSQHDGVWAQYWDASAYRLEARNCVFIGCGYAFHRSLSSGSFAVGNCRFYGCYQKGYDVDLGGNSEQVCSAFLGGLFDFPLRVALGWSPFRPWEPIWSKGITLKDPVIDNADSGYTTSSDMYDDARPGWRGYDIGAVEARARAEPETTVVRNGTYSAKLAGAGYHEVLRPVEAGSLTVSVWAYRDANYSGNPPKLQVLSIPGQADQEAAMTGGAGVWEQLSVEINPTSDGIVRIRLVSEDTSANGECYFDDLAVE
ncbi:MAG: right-handed parallel beta-helix repeat-containing protein [Anaerolineae bacterium]|nr:right-handed parallel beta-helix repeat-containing protein [Anaerolineae bacterium]